MHILLSAFTYFFSAVLLLVLWMYCPKLIVPADIFTSTYIATMGFVMALLLSNSCYKEKSSGRGSEFIIKNDTLFAAYLVLLTGFCILNNTSLSPLDTVLASLYFAVYNILSFMFILVIGTIVLAGYRFWLSEFERAAPQ